MRNVQLSLLALLLHAGGLDAKTFKKNIPTYEVGPPADIDGNMITYNEPDCDDGLDCKTIKSCNKPGYSPSLSEDKKYFACCAAGQRLLGSPDTAFDCCAKGHDLAGNSHCGFHCCPTGYDYDGQTCKKLCDNGKALVDGKCVCPKGTTESSDGTCKDKEDPENPEDEDDEECTSGLESGKCYIFTAANGNRLGLGAGGFYFAGPDGMNQRYGKFQLCLDEKCTPGKPINPSDEVFIRDTYGDLATGANKNQWLHRAINGEHINRWPTFDEAGHFAISKWPCGKYCLGGVTEGVGPACPIEMPALTFYSQDPQMCVEYDFMEVPCDLKNNANNCIWKSGDQCCNKVDCSKKENASNSSIPVSPSPHASPDKSPSEDVSQDNASPGDALPEVSSPESASPSNHDLPDHPSQENTSPEDASLEDSLPKIASPENASPDNALPDKATPDNASPDNASPDNASPDNTSPAKGSADDGKPWEFPLSYGTPLLIAALGPALLAMFPRLRKAGTTQPPVPKDGNSEDLVPKESPAPTRPEKDLKELSEETRQSVSRYTAAARSHYTTKSSSMSIISTSDGSYQEVTSTRIEDESNGSNSTPEELGL